MLMVEHIGNKMDIQIFGNGPTVLGEFGVLAASLMRKPGITEEVLTKIIKAAAMENTNNYMTEQLQLFARRLSHLMEVTGLREADLAGACDIDKRELRLYMTGQSHPPIGVLEKMAKEFGVTPEYLLGDK